MSFSVTPADFPPQPFEDDTVPTTTLSGYHFNLALTDAEIADTQRQNGPTINLTVKIQAYLDSLIATYVGPPNPTTKSAGMAFKVGVSGSYLVDGLSIHPAIHLVGDNFRDTIIVQSSTPNGPLLRGLARNGQASGARSPYWMINDIQLLGSNSLTSTGLVTSAIFLDDSDTDPENILAGAVLGHNAVIATNISVSNFSGPGVYIPKKRHGPKFRGCYFQGSGKVKSKANTDPANPNTFVAQFDGTGQYGPNVYDNSDSDAEYTACGCGGAAGDSYFFQNGETCQINGGDCWPSSNPEQGYFAIRATSIAYMKVLGVDINGKCYFKGDAGKASQIRFIGNNMRFRQSSFGTDDDTGMPAPLDSYLEFEDCAGPVLFGNTYTPYYAPITGLVAARPSLIWKSTGQTKLTPMERLPAFDSNDWPAGATIGPTPDKSTITNNWDKLNPVFTIIDSAAKDYTLVKFLKFAGGSLGSGIFGVTDGSAAVAGVIGEIMKGTVAQGAPVAMATSGTTYDIKSQALTPGKWQVYWTLKFRSSAATITVFRAGVNIVSATLALSVPEQSQEANVSMAAVSGNVYTMHGGDYLLNLSSAATVYLSAASVFSAGSMAAFCTLTCVRVG